MRTKEALLRLAQLRRPVFVAYDIALLLLTLAPIPTRVSWAPSWADKVVHAGLFFGFAILLDWNLGGTLRRRAPVVLVTSAGVAGGIELLQVPLQFRSGDPWDFAWGVVGATVGYWTWRVATGFVRA